LPIWQRARIVITFTQAIPDVVIPIDKAKKNGFSSRFLVPKHLIRRKKIGVREKSVSPNSSKVDMFDTCNRFSQRKCIIRALTHSKWVRVVIMPYLYAVWITFQWVFLIWSLFVKVSHLERLHLSHGRLWISGIRILVLIDSSTCHLEVRKALKSPILA
jgi:hypothetical protein